MQIKDKAKIFALLGFAQKAGVLYSGDTAIERAVNDNKVQLVIIAADAAVNTYNKISCHCAKHGVYCVKFSDKESLGNAIGKSPRSAIAVREKNFAETIKKWFECNPEVKQ